MENQNCDCKSDIRALREENRKLVRKVETLYGGVRRVTQACDAWAQRTFWATAGLVIALAFILAQAFLV